MIPIRLYLKKSIGIKRGLGLEEIEIDFTKLEPGIIGIIGKTGSGKSVIAESCTPHLRMISRGGALQRHFYGNDAIKEFEFEAGDGKRYLSKVLIDAESNLIKPYLFELREDGTNVSLSEKKADYNLAIQNLLGDFDSFTHSVFTAQDVEPILTLSDAELKSIIIKLFRLDKYKEVYIPFIKEQLSNIDSDIANARAEIRLIQDDREKLKNIEKEIKYLEDELPKKEHLFDQANAKYEENFQEIDRVKQIINELNIKNQELKHLYERRDRIRLELSEANASLKEFIDSFDKRYKSNKRYMEETIEEMAMEKQYASRAKRIIDNKDKIIEKYNELVSLRDRLESLNSTKKDIDKAQSELDQILSSINFTEKQLESTNKIIEMDELQVELLDQAPCAGMDINNICPYLQGARESVDDVKRGKIKKADIISKIEELKRQRDEKQKFVSDNNNTDLIQEVESAIDNIVNDKWEELYKEIPNSESIMDKYEHRINTLEKRISTCEEIAKGLEEEKDQHIKNRENAVFRKKNEYDDIVSKIEKAEYSTDVNNYEEKLRKLDYEQIELRGIVLEANQSVANVKSEIKSNIKQCDELIKRINKSKDREKKINLLLNDYEEWKLLEKACNDIPILELESSSKVLTDHINNLLVGLFDYDLTVKIATQMDRHDGKSKKEVFKILVFNDGEETLPQYLSGGQKQIVDMAIRMGIELTINDTTDRQYKTSFLDEADSDLDTERAVKYFQMLEKVHNKNKKHFTFLISHRTENKSSMNQIIDLEELAA